MKPLLLALALSFSAGATAQKATQAELQETCLSIESLASTYMQARQGGVPLRTLLGDLDNDRTPLFRQILLAAYDRPKYSGKQAQDDAIARFANDVLLQCLKDI